MRGIAWIRFPGPPGAGLGIHPAGHPAPQTAGRKQTGSVYSVQHSLTKVYKLGGGIF